MVGEDDRQKTVYKRDDIIGAHQYQDKSTSIGALIIAASLIAFTVFVIIVLYYTFPQFSMGSYFCLFLELYSSV